jgi:hypothetical protein
LCQYTDAKGRFHFEALPGALPIQLKVQARGSEQRMSVSPAAHGDPPLIIGFQTLEE